MVVSQHGQASCMSSYCMSKLHWKVELAVNVNFIKPLKSQVAEEEKSIKFLQPNESAHPRSAKFGEESDNF
jgi:hypothetical protein